MRFNLLLFYSVCLLFTSCTDDDQSAEVGTDDSLSSRTTLIYIVADNSLDSYVSMDIEEMKEGYSEVADTTLNKLLVYVDDYSKPYLLKFAKEYNQLTKKQEIVIDTIATYQEQNSLDTNTMSGVINYALTTNPADSYGLVLWSHGNGWLPGTTQESATRAFGEDQGNDPDGEGFYMDILDLRQALESCPKFEYIMYDACMMQGIEVAYELRNCTKYSIASPVEIPGYGANYEDVVPAFFSEKDAAEKVTQAYFDYYNSLYNYTGGNINSSGTILEFIENNFWIPGIGSGYYPGSGLYTYGLSISLIASDGLEDLAKATKNILPRYIKDGQTIKTSGIYNYDDNFYNYYYDFKSFISSLNGNDTYYTAWEKAFNNAVPIYLTTSYTYSSFANKGMGGMSDMSGTCGISTYIPANINFMDGYYWKRYLLVYPQNTGLIKKHQTYLNKYYQSFSWYEASGWNETGW